MAVPTLDHYLPLLYVLGAQDKADGVGFFADKVTLGAMSMRSVMASFNRSSSATQIPAEFPRSSRGGRA